MTGFGRAEHAGEGLIARVEIATVNRKQADIHFNLPRDEVLRRPLDPDARGVGRLRVGAMHRRRCTMENRIEFNASAAAYRPEYRSERRHEGHLFIWWTQRHQHNAIKRDLEMERRRSE